MPRRTGTPIGDAALTLVRDEWNNFNGKDWMTPGRPAKIKERGGVRVMAYPSYYNTSSDGEEGVEPDNNAPGLSFSDLREFADTHEITRIVIETCKEQLVKLRYGWRLIPKEKETAQEIKDKSEADPRIKELMDFFESPDKEHDFHQWLRIMLEEILVCDVVAIIITWILGADPTP